jgi:hypothetical protein
MTPAWVTPLSFLAICGLAWLLVFGLPMLWARVRR